MTCAAAEPDQSSRGIGDRGSGVVLVLGLVGVVAGMAVAICAFGAAALARHQAEAAADLAALAAASVEPGADCGLAAAVSKANGGVLTDCQIRPDGSVVVTVRVGLEGGFGAGRGWQAVGRARAGQLP